MRVSFIDAGGVRTRVLHEGDKEPRTLLLVHGFGGLAEHWLRNIDALSRHYRVIAPDLIGHGFTERVALDGQPPHPRTAAHLLAVLDRLGVDKFSVVGSSYGALISTLLYFERPDRVEKLVICGSGSMFNTDEELAKALPQAYENAMGAMRSATLEACRVRLGNICFDPAAVPEATALANLISIALPGVVEAYGEAMRGMMDMEKSRAWRVLDRLETIRLSSLIVWGREDPRGVYQRAVECVKRFPDARLVTFERCGHLPFLEHPDLFNAEVLRFLSSEPGGNVMAARASVN